MADKFLAASRLGTEAKLNFSRAATMFPAAVHKA